MQHITFSEVGNLMERMYRLFSIRQRSEKEVRDYFKNLSFQRKIKNKEEVSLLIIETVVARLKEVRLIDDLAFAKSWVESRRRKKGIRIIKQELLQKGISKEIIEVVMSEQTASYSEMQTAQQLLEKKMRIWKNLQRLEFKKKAYDFLLRRGFEYEIVKSTVEKVIQK